MALRLGDVAVDKVCLGSTAVDKVYVGDQLVWQSVVLLSAGMLKSGVQSPTIAQSTWTEITSFTADPAYPATNLATNKLVASGPGTATVTASVQWSGGSASKNARVKVNGVVVSTAGAVDAAATTQAWSFAQSLVAGDLVSLEAWCDSGTSARRDIAASGTSLRYVV